MGNCVTSKKDGCQKPEPLHMATQTPATMSRNISVQVERPPFPDGDSTFPSLYQFNSHNDFPPPSAAAIHFQQLKYLSECGNAPLILPCVQPSPLARKENACQTDPPADVSVKQVTNHGSIEASHPPLSVVANEADNTLKNRAPHSSRSDPVNTPSTTASSKQAKYPPRARHGHEILARENRNNANANVPLSRLSSFRQRTESIHQSRSHFFDVVSGKLVIPPFTTATHPYEYTFFVDERDDAVKDFFDSTDRRVISIARRTQCNIYLYLRQTGEEPVFHRGIYSTPITVVAPKLSVLRQCLRLMDKQYPQFQVMTYHYENEAHQFGYVKPTG